MKKRILLLLVCMVMLLSGCGQTAYKGSKKFDTQYREWVDGIGIMDNKSGKMTHLNEKGNTVELGVLCDDAKSCEDLCSVVNAHNEFVDSDPGYFRTDTQICILGTMKSWFTPVYFFNGSNAYFDMSRFGESFDMDDTAKMQFALVEVGALPQGMSQMNGTFNVPVVILRYNNSSLPGDDSYKVLERFSGLEQVMIEYMGMEYDPEDVCESIRKYAPGVRVYDDTEKKYVD